jgi:hypothetical protein
MIISAPTALYDSILPQEPENAGNVTWTISSNDPPRPDTVTPIINTIEEMKPLPPLPFNPSERPINTGAFVFSLNTSTSKIAGSGKKIFEVGQILEFTEEEQQAVTTKQTPDIIDLQQNTNILDIDDVGLTPEEIVGITEDARTRFNLLTDQINSLTSDINILKIEISDNQKSINEVTKVKNAAILIYGENSQIVQRLTLKEESLLMQKDELIAQVDAKNLEIDAKYNELLKIRELVR